LNRSIQFGGLINADGSNDKDMERKTDIENIWNDEWIMEKQTNY